MVWTAKPLWLAAGLGLAGAAQAVPGNLYCCSDPSTGRQICADLLPLQCPKRSGKRRGSKTHERGKKEQKNGQENTLKKARKKDKQDKGQTGTGEEITMENA